MKLCKKKNNDTNTDKWFERINMGEPINTKTQETYPTKIKRKNEGIN